MSAPRKSILVLSLSKHLTTHPISTVLEADWARPKANTMRSHFDNVGFDLVPTDVPGTLEAVRHKLQERHWDAVLIGWCTRGHVEFTDLFEGLVGVCVERIREGSGMKLLFNRGPEDLVGPVVRNFSSDSEGGWSDQVV